MDQCHIGTDAMGRADLGNTDIYSNLFSGYVFFAMNDYEKDVVRKPVLKVFEKIKTRKL